MKIIHRPFYIIISAIALAGALCTAALGQGQAGGGRIPGTTGKPKESSPATTILTEDGSQEEGRLQGPWLYLDSAGRSIKGSMFYKGNRVDWASGFFWSWCGR